MKKYSFSVVGLVLLTITATGSVAAASSGETTTIYCWDASIYDTDRDGYARDEALGSDREAFVVTKGELICPAGYVKARGDCDDYNAIAHPRRTEIFGNSSDDNCNGLVDESTFHYHFDDALNGRRKFSMDVRIHDAQVVAVWRNRTSGLNRTYLSYPVYLSYQIQYEPLHSSSAAPLSTGVATGAEPLDTPIQRVMSMDTDRTIARTTLELTGLDRNTMYRARVIFYQTTPAHTMGTYKAERNEQIGDPSVWYYTVTLGRGAENRARNAMVLRSLHHFYLSNTRGFVGYQGTRYENGTRYGAEVGEAWCSEYYSWIASRELEDMGSKGFVTNIISWFSDFDVFHDIDTTSDFDYFLSHAKHGDYLAEDNSAGAYIHSAMFLAYDNNTGECWTLDGNAAGVSEEGRNRLGGHEVWVRQQNCDVIAGWGEIITDML